MLRVTQAEVRKFVFHKKTLAMQARVNYILQYQYLDVKIKISSVL